MLWKGKPPFTFALLHQQIDSTSQILLMLSAVVQQSWETSRFIQGKGKRLEVIHSQRWCVCFPDQCVTKRTGEMVPVFRVDVVVGSRPWGHNPM